MATKLGLFNAALLELGHDALSDTGEAIEAGRLLNQQYSQVVEECLSSGSWNFAMETIQADADTGVTPNFGFAKVFAKPSDWLRTHAVSADENFGLPLLQYYDDMNFWSADYSPIYIRYVSNDTGLGFELNRWTPAFARFVSLELATRVGMKISQSESKLEEVRKERDRARRIALNQDCMNEPNPKFAPLGSWNSSRSGRFGNRERGNRGSFTG